MKKLIAVWLRQLADRIDPSMPPVLNVHVHGLAEASAVQAEIAKVIAHSDLAAKRSRLA